MMAVPTQCFLHPGVAGYTVLTFRFDMLNNGATKPLNILPFRGCIKTDVAVRLQCLLHQWEKSFAGLQYVPVVGK